MKEIRTAGGEATWVAGDVADLAALERLHEPLLVHWTGGDAGTVHPPGPDLGGLGDPLGVSAASTGNLWAVGYAAPPTGGNATLVLRGAGG